MLNTPKITPNYHFVNVTCTIGDITSAAGDVTGTIVYFTQAAGDITGAIGKYTRVAGVITLVTGDIAGVSGDNTEIAGDGNRAAVAYKLYAKNGNDLIFTASDVNNTYFFPFIFIPIISGIHNS